VLNHQPYISLGPQNSTFQERTSIQMQLLDLKGVISYGVVSRFWGPLLSFLQMYWNYSNKVSFNSYVKLCPWMKIGNCNVLTGRAQFYLKIHKVYGHWRDLRLIGKMRVKRNLNRMWIWIVSGQAPDQVHRWDGSITAAYEGRTWLIFPPETGYADWIFSSLPAVSLGEKPG
jgi:hypothetical protein